MADEKQETLFDIPNWWEEHWQDMPEFIQEGRKAYAEIIVRFRNETDLKEFAKLIGQKVTTRSSIWFPKLIFRDTSNRAYIEDENK